MRKIIQLAGYLPLIIASVAAAQGPVDTEIERHGIHGHSAIDDPYKLKASVLRSGMLPPAVAKEHGIEVAPDRGILNVAVYRFQDGSQMTVPADVTAVTISLLGQTSPIPMRTVVENEHVTYIGSFEYGPQPTLRFEVNALPKGGNKPLAVEFEERMEPARR